MSYNIQQVVETLPMLTCFVVKGQLDRIRIHPGKVMKIIATLKGAIKKYVGKF